MNAEEQARILAATITIQAELTELRKWDARKKEVQIKVFRAYGEQYERTDEEAEGVSRFFHELRTGKRPPLKLEEGE